MMEPRYFQNPVLRGYADPDILLHDGVYYLYATSYHVGRGYEVYTSEDLVNWENRGLCLLGEDVEKAWGLNCFYWAPDVKYHNGRFYMLVTVAEHLGLAVADSPLGPFAPQDGFLFDHSIDGHILFEDEDMYIYYVTWREGHDYALWGCRMNGDHRTPELSTEKLLLKAMEPYERHMAAVVEAPYILKKDGVYYLTYSACTYESPFYCVCYATADAPLGDFVRYERNPILVGDGKTISGTGHHCVTPLPDGGYALMYHAHEAPGKIHPRNLYVGRIGFEPRGDHFVLVCDPPTTERQAYLF